MPGKNVNPARSLGRPDLYLSANPPAARAHPLLDVTDTGGMGSITCAAATRQPWGFDRKHERRAKGMAEPLRIVDVQRGGSASLHLRHKRLRSTHASRQLGLGLPDSPARISDGSAKGLKANIS